MKKHILILGFTPTDLIIWLVSCITITASFFGFGCREYLSLTASLIGATSLIFNAKGNPIGQVLMIAFSLVYGYISFGFTYYGEMLTYVGMTAPMAAVALVSWLRHPFLGNKAEVAIRRLVKKDIVFMLVLTGFVTAAFYFVLKFFGTANLLPSTVSVTTSFAAAYLTYKRSPYFAIAYAANDVVLIVLWVMASLVSREYISVTVCFAIFLINDIYGFISWRRLERRQRFANACN